MIKKISPLGVFGNSFKLIWKRKLAVLAYLAVGVLMLGVCFAFLTLWGTVVPDNATGEQFTQQVPSLWFIFGGFGVIAFFLLGYKAWSLSLQYHFFLAQAGQSKYLPPKLLTKTIFGVGYSYAIGIVTGFITLPIPLLGVAKYAGMNSMMALLSLSQDITFLAAVFTLWAVLSAALYVRLSLVFPAIAYGRNSGLLDVWQISKGHGIRLFVSALLFFLFMALTVPLAVCAQFMDGMGGIALLSLAGIILVLSEVLWNAMYAVWYKELLLRGIRLKRAGAGPTQRSISTRGVMQPATVDLKL
ncbi:hypothetical protein [Salidesulfovibrio onnuriiensis]|uniref:hypothetical protein n=1 Tax=Salidesulfovibrio onnuriiensis TaxID=2583823 RepID=UPI0011C70649|nr:hypothetical protein [Salidesulfovibrio onnuriiensis]